MQPYRRHFCQGLRQSESGQAMIEFAISCTVLLAVLLGILQCSLALYADHFVSYSAQQGARYAIVRGSHWGSTACETTTSYACNATAANITSYVRSLATAGLTSPDIQVTTTWPGESPDGTASGCSTPNSDGCMVQVTVAYPFQFSIPFFPSSRLSFKATSEMVVQE